MSVRFEPNAEPVPGYRLIDRIGSGGFGEVWKCIAPGNIFKAIKIIHGDLRSKDNDLVRYAEQELKSMERVKKVRHPYLLAIDRYDIVEGRLLIIMELADCNLWDRFRVHRQKGLIGIPREELLLYMQETAEVLDLMNVEHGLLHLDIKPQNIFLQYNHVKVGDFGQVKDLQGHAAQVTGGITPVYAAPETFDGIVTRQCDQYSLACVFQELLTGQRPFDGTSMNQLLMQHLAGTPNLMPSPAGDRPALERALAKKHTDRFPTCTEFVRHLRDGTPTGSVVQSLGVDLVEPPDPSRSEIQFDLPGYGSSLLLPVASAETETPLGPVLADNDPVTFAPPEQTGPGCLRPTLVIGLGGLGLTVLQRFRRTVIDRFGSPEQLPVIRTLFLDTDPETAAAAEAEQRSDRFAPLRPSELVVARLNRAQHYLKPRVAGLTITDGWFDTQLLHRMGRNPSSLGLRPLGRLAFCDHYRAVEKKIHTELEEALTPQAMATSTAATGMTLRTNRPRVYIVTGLAGGTGGGMFLDVAYTVRHRLKRLGYADADVVGILLTPADSNDEPLSPQARANVFAALTELNHYSRPDTTFTATYDDRTNAQIRDSAPPFRSVYILPAPSAIDGTATPSGSGFVPQTGSNRRTSSDARRTTADYAARRAGAVATSQVLTEDPTSMAAEILRHDLFTGFGRTLDESRPEPPKGNTLTVRTTGMTRYSWPRGEVIERTARVLTGVVINHWVAPDQARMSGLIMSWVVEQMETAGLSRETVLQRLYTTAAEAIGEPIPTAITRLVDPITPRGWMPRVPDRNQLNVVLDHLGRLIGVPGTAKMPMTLTDPLRNTGGDIASHGLTNLTAAVRGLADDLRFRLAGAEEAVQQILAYLQSGRAECEAEADRCETESRTWYERLLQGVSPGKKISPAEVADALRLFPAAQFRSVVLRRAARVYQRLREQVAELRTEVSGCRQRVEAIQQSIVKEMDKSTRSVSPKCLMPVGCGSIEEAAQRYLSVLTDEDLHEIENWVQDELMTSFGGLYEAGLNTADGPTQLLRVVREQTRQYLNYRMGEVDLAGMFEFKFGALTDCIAAIRDAFDQAKPLAVGSGPWANNALTVVGMPDHPAVDRLRQYVLDGLPHGQLTALVDLRDEVQIYREYPTVPLAALPQFGPAWGAAYQTAPDSQQCTPHSRTDVTSWVGVDTD